MYYRVAALKKDDNAKEFILQANSLEEVEAQIEKIKAFLYPGEDSKEYRWVTTRFTQLVNNVINMPFYRITVYRPVPHAVIEKEFEEACFDDFSWLENIVTADSLEEARKKALENGVLFDHDLKPEDYTLFVEEVSVDTLIEEEENRIKNQIKKNLLYSENRTIREIRELEKNEAETKEFYYSALKKFSQKWRLLRHLLRVSEKEPGHTVESMKETLEKLVSITKEEEFNQVYNAYCFTKEDKQ